MYLYIHLSLVVVYILHAICDSGFTYGLLTNPNLGFIPMLTHEFISQYVLMDVGVMSINRLDCVSRSLDRLNHPLWISLIHTACICIDGTVLCYPSTGV